MTSSVFPPFEALGCPYYVSRCVLRTVDRTAQGRQDTHTGLGSIVQTQCRQRSEPGACGCAGTSMYSSRKHS